jgi:hypothetical protein
MEVSNLNSQKMQTAMNSALDLGISLLMLLALA